MSNLHLSFCPSLNVIHSKNTRFSPAGAAFFLGKSLLHYSVSCIHAVVNQNIQWETKSERNFNMLF